MRLHDLGFPGTVDEMETKIKEFLDKTDEDEQCDLSYAADQLAFLVRHFQLGKRSNYEDMDRRITQFLETIDVLKLPQAYLRIVNNDYGFGHPAEFKHNESTSHDVLERTIAR